MNINYGPYEAMMHPSIPIALTTRQHPLGKNNAYPKQSNPLDGNFEQICAKKRFADVIDKYQTISDSKGMEPEEFVDFLNKNIMEDGMGSAFKIQDIEKDHIKTLEKLGIKTVCDDFNIKDGEIIFNVNIKPMGDIDRPEEMLTDEEIALDPPELNEENFEYDFDDEVQKRQLINALISGASKKGHYIFHLCRESLNAIDERLLKLYQMMMSLNDLSYFFVDDELVQTAMNGDGEEFVGYEKLTFTEDGTPILTIEAVNFPTLLHELIKGVLEIIATLALPEDKALTDYVYGKADYATAELWYLRLGPIFWEHLSLCLPPNYSHLKSQILGKLFELPTDDFNDMMRLILSEDARVMTSKIMTTWAEKIEANIHYYNQSNT